MRTIRILSAASAVALAISLAACGGGGGGSSLPTTGGQAPVIGQAATAQFTINIPAKASQGFTRHGQYISASTKSMTISTLSNNVATQAAEVDLTTASPNCSASGGALVCTVKYLSTAGSNMYEIDMYDAIGGKGNKLSTGNVQATLVAGQDTVVPLVLNGVPATAAVVLGSATLPVGSAGSVSVLVQAKDGAGNLIIGPGDYSSAIPLAITGDTYKTLSLSEQSVKTPGQAVSLNYTGGSNIGATITPSVGGVAGTAALFNGTGTATNIFTYEDTADGFYSYSYGAAAIPGTNTAAMILQLDHTACCLSSVSGIAIVGPTGVQKVFTGDQVDPVTSSSPTYSKLTVVHGMMRNVQQWSGDDVAKEIAVSPTGTIYYGGQYYTNSSYCPGGSAYYAGTIGALNPTAGTTTEQATHGAPLYMQLDASGTLWFIEATPSYCTSTGGLTSTYYIGKLTSAGTLTETSFAAAGLPNGYPGTMQLSNDGTQMYIGFANNDSGGGNLAQLALPAFGSPTTITLTNSKYVYASTMATDGTLLWSSDTEPGEHYRYGYLPGGSAFSLGNVIENTFPVHYESSYGMTYADGSFWVGNDYNSGIVRLNGWATGAMQNQWYQFPQADNDEPEITGVAASSGYIYAGDDEYGNIYAMQYGAPANATITSNARSAQLAPQAMTVRYPMGSNAQPRNPHAGRQKPPMH